MAAQSDPGRSAYCISTACGFSAYQLPISHRLGCSSYPPPKPPPGHGLHAPPRCSRYLLIYQVLSAFVLAGFILLVIQSWRERRCHYTNLCATCKALLLCLGLMPRVHTYTPHNAGLCALSVYWLSCFGFSRGCAGCDPMHADSGLSQVHKKTGLGRLKSSLCVVLARGGAIANRAHAPRAPHRLDASRVGQGRPRRNYDALPARAVGAGRARDDGDARTRPPELKRGARDSWSFSSEYRE